MPRKNKNARRREKGRWTKIQLTPKVLALQYRTPYKNKNDIYQGRIAAIGETVEVAAN